MKLNVTVLDDVEDVNDYHYATDVKSNAGDPIQLYFQLSDASKNLAQAGYNPSGLRYVPVSGATLQITFLNINNRKQFTRFASQPFTQDPSIWSVPILATDPVSGTVSCKFVLSEPSSTGFVTKTCYLNACFLVDGTNTVGDPRPEQPWGW